MNKPRLLCIEGPAGIGKTTLSNVLFFKAKQNDLNIKVISEFSSTELGGYLSKTLERFTNNPSSLSTAQTLIHCICDKLASLLDPHPPQSAITVIDRGFISQTVLAIPNISANNELSLALSLIDFCNNWLTSCYELKTLFLSLPVDENIKRLEGRLGRPLNVEEIEIMNYEVKQYHALAKHHNTKSLGAHHVDASLSPEKIAESIIFNFIKQ